MYHLSTEYRVLLHTEVSNLVTTEYKCEQMAVTAVQTTLSQPPGLLRTVSRLHLYVPVR